MSLNWDRKTCSEQWVLRIKDGFHSKKPIPTRCIGKTKRDFCLSVPPVQDQASDLFQGWDQSFVYIGH